MATTIVIEKLESYYDVYNLVSRQFKPNRSEFKDSKDCAILEFSNIEFGKVNLPALLFLLSFLHSIRKTYAYPFIGIYNNTTLDFSTLAYLKEIKFVELSQKLRIIEWQGIEGYHSLPINPNTSLHFFNFLKSCPSIGQYYDSNNPYNEEKHPREIFGDILNDADANYNYEIAKRSIKIEIQKQIADTIRNVFTVKEAMDLRERMVNYTAELLLNSFIHGRRDAFYLVQRNKKKITICVADDGIGFERSFSTFHQKQIPRSEAIVRACRYRLDNSYGVYDVIKSVVGMDKPEYGLNDRRHGVVTINDGDKLLRITRDNIERLGDCNDLMADEIKTLNDSIRGVRISIDIYTGGSDAV